MKSRILAVIAIVIVWIGLDCLIHGNLLMEQYKATMHLWRPMAEMSPLIMNGVTILGALIFTFIYCQMIENKALNKGIKLGAFIGLLTGVMGGLGSYGYMPITTTIALGWFAANLVKFTVAGAIAGALVKTNMTCCDKK